jgi:hypothetical protein
MIFMEKNKLLLIITKTAIHIRLWLVKILRKKTMSEFGSREASNGQQRATYTISDFQTKLLVIFVVNYNIFLYIYGLEFTLA